MTMPLIMPYRECPSFNNCSAPRCPLDPEIKDRIRLKGEEKCVAWKTTRLKIAQRYPNLLKYGGLTAREWYGKKNWDNKSDAEKEFFTEQGTKRLKLAKSQGKGGVDGENV